jgi:hypothetical protein
LAVELHAIIREKQDVRRQQNILQANLEREQTPGSNLQLSQGAVTAERMEQIIQENQLLTRRILALERRQRGLEEDIGEEAPPDYAAVRPTRAT